MRQRTRLQAARSPRRISRKRRAIIFRFGQNEPTIDEDDAEAPPSVQRSFDDLVVVSSPNHTVNGSAVANEPMDVTAVVEAGAGIASRRVSYSVSIAWEDGRLLTLTVGVT